MPTPPPRIFEGSKLVTVVTTPEVISPAFVTPLLIISFALPIVLLALSETSTTISPKFSYKFKAPPNNFPIIGIFDNFVKYSDYLQTTD